MTCNGSPNFAENIQTSGTWKAWPTEKCKDPEYWLGQAIPLPLEYGNPDWYEWKASQGSFWRKLCQRHAWGQHTKTKRHQKRCEDPDYYLQQRSSQPEHDKWCSDAPSESQEGVTEADPATDEWQHTAVYGSRFLETDSAILNQDLQLPWDWKAAFDTRRERFYYFRVDKDCKPISGAQWDFPHATNKMS